MRRDWEVLKRIGRRMTLECGQEQRLVREPTRPYAKQLFHMATPGQVIDDEIVGLFVSGRAKKRLPDRWHADRVELSDQAGDPDPIGG